MADFFYLVYDCENNKFVAIDDKNGFYTDPDEAQAAADSYNSIGGKKKDARVTKHPFPKVEDE